MPKFMTYTCFKILTSFIFSMTVNYSSDVIISTNICNLNYIYTDRISASSTYSHPLRPFNNYISSSCLFLVINFFFFYIASAASSFLFKILKLLDKTYSHQKSSWATVKVPIKVTPGSLLLQHVSLPWYCQEYPRWSEFYM